MTLVYLRRTSQKDNTASTQVPPLLQKRRARVRQTLNKGSEESLDIEKETGNAVRRLEEAHSVYDSSLLRLREAEAALRAARTAAHTAQARAHGCVLEIWKLRAEPARSSKG
jgi:hypothetical protein